MKHGTGHGRGRHRNAGSPETRRWEQIAPTVDGWKTEPGLGQKPKKRRRKKPKPTKRTPLSRPPLRPDWMSESTYKELTEMRSQLEAPSSSTPTTMEAP